MITFKRGAGGRNAVYLHFLAQALRNSGWVCQWGYQQETRRKEEHLLLQFPPVGSHISQPQANVPLRRFSILALSCTGLSHLSYASNTPLQPGLSNCSPSHSNLTSLPFGQAYTFGIAPTLDLPPLASAMMKAWHLSFYAQWLLLTAPQAPKLRLSIFLDKTAVGVAKNCPPCSVLCCSASSLAFLVLKERLEKGIFIGFIHPCSLSPLEREYCLPDSHMNPSQPPCCLFSHCLRKT